LIDKPIYGKYALVRKSDQSDQSDQSGNTDQNDHSDQGLPTLIGTSETDQSSIDLQEAVNDHSDHSDRYIKGISNNGVPEGYTPSERSKDMIERLRARKEKDDDPGISN
jgi:hypothetical protein